MASTITLQNIVDSVRAYPDLEPMMTAAGFSQEPALNIANHVMQRFLAQGMNWKFNRAAVPPFLTVPLQQDYVTSLTTLAWLEQGIRIDINNTVFPKPIFTCETVRDLSQTSFQANTFNLAWIPNSLAIMGQWKANTLYPCGYGQAFTLPSPIQQFRDANNNILYISSASLGLNVNTPGFGGTGFVPPGAPYGTSGNVQPVLPANSAAGATVVDGTVTWTVADPNGVAIRVSPLPAVSAIVWLLVPLYQKKPPRFTTLQQTLDPIPDEFEYLFSQGFFARAYQHAGSRTANEAYSQWEEALMMALRSADREREEASFYPTQGLTGGNPWRYGMPIGPAWPFDYYPGGY